MAATLHPLIARLIEQHGCSNVAAEALDAFAAQPGETVLFFSEDPVRYKETLDLAVILPEIAEASRVPFRVGVLLPEAANRHAQKYGVRRWPALVFLRSGGFLGTIEGLREWQEFVTLSQALLTGPIHPLPTKVIAIAAGGPPACH